MPHTNRRTKASGPVGAEFTHSNRRNIQDGTGWSHVVNMRGGTGGRRAARSTVKLPTQNDEYAYANSSIAQMHKNLAYYSQKWASDRASQELHMMLDDSNSGVENVLCLGLGSLHNANLEGQRASWMQLVALRAILDTLGDIVISPVVFQDPAFSAMDKEFLTSLGYNVVDPPFAWDKVTRESLVYGIHCYNDVIRTVLDDMRPAMMIRNILYTELWNPETHGNLAYHTQLRSEYHEDDFPQPQKSNAFSDTKIYWRNIGKPATPPATPPPAEHTTTKAEENTSVEPVQQATAPASATPTINITVPKSPKEVAEENVSIVAPTPIIHGSIPTSTEKDDDTTLEKKENSEHKAEHEDNTVKVAKPSTTTVNPLSAVEESDSESTRKLLQEDTLAAIPTPFAEEPIEDKNLHETNYPSVTTEVSSSNPKTQQEASVIVGGIAQQVGRIVSDGRIPECHPVSPISVGSEASKAASLSGTFISQLRSNASHPTNSPPLNSPSTVEARLIQRNNSPGSFQSSSPNTNLGRQQRPYFDAKAERMKRRIEAEEAVCRENARKQAEEFSIWLEGRRSTSPTNTDKKSKVILEIRASQHESPSSVNNDLVKGPVTGEKTGAAYVSEVTIKSEDASPVMDENTLKTHIDDSQSMKEIRIADAGAYAAIIKDATITEINKPVASVVDAVVIDGGNNEAGCPRALGNGDVVEVASFTEVNKPCAPFIAGTESINKVKIGEVNNSGASVVGAELIMDANIEKVKLGALIEFKFVKVASESIIRLAATESIETNGEKCKKITSNLNKSAGEFENHTLNTTTIIPRLDKKVSIVKETTTDGTEVIGEQVLTDAESAHSPKTRGVLNEFEKVAITGPNSEDVHRPQSFNISTKHKKVVIADKTVADATTNFDEEQLTRCSLDNHTPNSSTAVPEFVDEVIIAGQSIADGLDASQNSRDATNSQSPDAFIVQPTKDGKVIEGPTGGVSDICAHYPSKFAIDMKAAKMLAERSTADESNFNEEDFARDTTDGNTSGTSVSDSSETGGEGEAKKIKTKNTEPYKITFQAARKGEFNFSSIKFHGPLKMKNLSIGGVNFGEVAMPNGLFIEVRED